MKVTISGHTYEGKTTLAHLLALQLELCGIQCQIDDEYEENLSPQDIGQRTAAMADKNVYVTIKTEQELREGCCRRTER